MNPLYTKASAAILLAFLMFIGFCSERMPQDTHSSGAFKANARRVSAVPESRTTTPNGPLGPWAIYRPPRKMRPRVYARAACVVDWSAGSVLYTKQADTALPIASLVKLLTALVYLESGGTLTQEIEITPADGRNAGKSVLWKGHKFRALDVLYTALLSSDNRAARALARSTPYPYAQFLEKMNERAQQIGCTTLKVTDPTGLAEDNVASALDVARLLAAALANPTIAGICKTYRYEFRAQNSRKTYRLVNSNRLLPSKYRVRGGKTGYIVESGWCLAVMLDTDTGPLAVVVLGARSNSSRFTQARRLILWTLKHRNRSSLFAIAS